MSYNQLNNFQSLDFEIDNCGLTVISALYNYRGTEILASYSNNNIYLFDVNGRCNTSIHKYSGHLNVNSGK